MLYGILTLPVLTLISVGVPGMFWLWPLDTYVRSVPLTVAIWIDGALYNDGELDPQMLPMWVLFTGVLLWPLLLVGVRPALCRSRLGRRVVVGYGGGAAVLTIAAACWIFTHTSYLF